MVKSNIVLAITGAFATVGAIAYKKMARKKSDRARMGARLRFEEARSKFSQRRKRNPPTL